MPSKYLVTGWPWFISDGELHFGMQKLRGVDLSTFQVLSMLWARDAKRVYCAGSVALGVDAETFQVLNRIYAKDASRAYTIQGPIREVTDTSTFTAFGPTLHPFNTINGYAKDAKTVFHTTEGGTACVVKNADAESFVARGHGYGSDKSNMYFERRKITGAEPTEWKYILGPYSCSGSKAYFKGERIRGVDGEYLEPLPVVGMSSYWCRDQKGYLDYFGKSTNPAAYFEDFSKCFIFIGKVSNVTLRWQRTSLDPTKADSWSKAEYARVFVECKQWIQRPNLEVTDFPKQGEPFVFGEGLHVPLLATGEWMNEDRIWIFKAEQNLLSDQPQLVLNISNLWWEYSSLAMRGVIEKTIVEAAQRPY